MVMTGCIGILMVIQLLSPLAIVAGSRGEAVDQVLLSNSNVHETAPEKVNERTATQAKIWSEFNVECTVYRAMFSVGTSKAPIKRIRVGGISRKYTEYFFPKDALPTAPLDLVAESTFCRGFSLQLQLQYKEALSEYDRALTINPRYSEALFSKAVSLLMVDGCTEAQAHALADSAVNNISALPAQFLSATVLFGLGKYDFAMAHVEEALRLSPDHRPSAILRQAIYAQVHHKLH